MGHGKLHLEKAQFIFCYLKETIAFVMVSLFIMQSIFKIVRWKSKLDSFSFFLHLLILYYQLSLETHCVKSVRLQSYSGPYFPAFALNTERYGVYVCIQSECGKVRTKITPDTDTFHAVTTSSGQYYSVYTGFERKWHQFKQILISLLKWVTNPWPVLYPYLEQIPGSS